MIVSAGYKRRMLVRVLASRDDRNVILYSGAMPSKEELGAELDNFDGNTSGVVYYYRAGPVLFNTWLTSREGCEMLAHTRFINSAIYENEGPNLVKDYTINTENLTHVADGIIGFMIEYSDEDNRNLLPTYSEGILLLSVGLPGSGADVELTSLEITESSNLRLNKFELGVA